MLTYLRTSALGTLWLTNGQPLLVTWASNFNHQVTGRFLADQVVCLIDVMINPIPIHKTITPNSTEFD